MPKKLICLNEIFLIKSKTFNVNYHSELNLKPWWATFPPGIIQIYYYYLLNFLIRLWKTKSEVPVYMFVPCYCWPDKHLNIFFKNVIYIVFYIDLFIVQIPSQNCW